MAKSKTTQKPVEELTYEEALAELEGIVDGLENEQNPLEAAITHYERGQTLLAHCGALLEAAQLKVQKLAGESLINFEDESE